MADKMFNDIMDSIINNASEEEIEIIIEQLHRIIQIQNRVKEILKKNVIIQQYRIIMNLKCQLKYKDFEHEFKFSKI